MSAAATELATLVHTVTAPAQWHLGTAQVLAQRADEVRAVRYLPRQSRRAMSVLEMVRPCEGVPAGMEAGGYHDVEDILSVSEAPCDSPREDQGNGCRGGRKSGA